MQKVQAVSTRGANAEAVLANCSGDELNAINLKIIRVHAKICKF